MHDVFIITFENWKAVPPLMGPDLIEGGFAFLSVLFYVASTPSLSIG